ncbi:hypothetical protein DERP_012408 [Dermatophagoides pteronyssinus]|uniref:Uncharacterized protein n=1 Tax=Dermatophagoides pteronyssinus TaxID=6956 RepID=A0ABQ8IUY9_DERPT|nr:hypothetical protein DERP_012408 [Dermatophagoides pteronyssinus]
MTSGVSSTCSIVSTISETSTNSVIGVTSSVTSPVFFTPSGVSSISSIVSTTSETSINSFISVSKLTSVFLSPSGVSSTCSMVSTTSEISTNSVIGVTSSVNSSGFLIFRIIFFVIIIIFLIFVSFNGSSKCSADPSDFRINLRTSVICSTISSSSLSGLLTFRMVIIIFFGLPGSLISFVVSSEINSSWMITSRDSSGFSVISSEEIACISSSSGRSIISTVPSGCFTVLRMINFFGSSVSTVPGFNLRRNNIFFHFSDSSEGISIIFS